MNNTYVVIMAGGIGSRFWPYSRSSKPKQFLDILGTGRTLIQQTFDRLLQVCPKENFYIVTNAEYNDIIMDQLPEIQPHQVLKEPLRKNTAPCIAYANHIIQQRDPQANIIVAPSDHLIVNDEGFIKVIHEGLRFVSENDALLTLGIRPSRPETGYGYIQVNGSKDVDDFECLRPVKTFTEKPNLDLAKIFLESGDFFWNSGMFIWSLPAILKAYDEHLHDMQMLFQDGDGIYGTDQELSFIEQVYGACDKISIDYGIMEKAENVYVLCADFGWSDLGTWGSLYDNIDKDDNGNTTESSQLMSFDTNKCMVKAPKEKLVVLQGLEDYIVVDTEDVLLVCKKEEEQRIREIVDEVKLRNGGRYI